MSSELEDQRRPRLAGLAIVALIVALVAGFGGGLTAEALFPSHTAGQSNGSTAGASGSCPVSAVAKRVLPSVVTISAIGPPPAGGGQAAGDIGSGEIIRSGGYIVTNNHVVSVAANGGSVEILYSDGSTAPAEIVGRDPLTDLAVIKVSSNRSLPPIALGSSASTEIGEAVVALGAPLGLSSTVTSGIISALDRTVSVPGENGQSALLINALQTDAAINPGNSGGALVNCSGQLIGIPSAGATVPNESGQSSGGSIGLGFAIPIDVVQPIVNQIIETGRAVHSYIGLTAEPASPDSSPLGTASGLLVTSVDPNGPADQAGLLQGDILTSIGGKAATSTDQLMEITLTNKPGTKITVGYSRQGRQNTAAITLGVQP